MFPFEMFTRASKTVGNSRRKVAGCQDPRRFEGHTYQMAHVGFVQNEHSFHVLLLGGSPEFLSGLSSPLACIPHQFLSRSDTERLWEGWVPPCS